jgi:hypothetical protein
MDLRNKALAANAAQLPFVEPKRLRLDTVLTEVRGLTVEQATLTFRKQDVSKRRAELMKEGSALLDVLDTIVRQEYGRSSEKLAEFGLQPARSRPRIVFVGPDGKRSKVPPAEEAPAEPTKS